MTGGFSLIIEFVGLPTSGKTTLARALAAELARLGYVVWRPEPVGGVRACLALARFPVVVLCGTLGLAKAPRTLRDRWFFLRRLVHALRIWAAARAAPQAVVVIDEGLRQRAMSVFTQADASDRYLAKLYGRRGPAPDILIRLRIEPDRFEVRQAARGRRLVSDHLGRRSGEDRLRALLTVDTVLDVCCDAVIGGHPGVVLLDLDANDLELCWPKLRSRVLQVVASGQAGGTTS